MKNNPKQLYAFLQSMGAIAWEADICMQQFSFIGDHDQSVLGFPQSTWRATPCFWESRLHPDDRHLIAAYSELNSCSDKVYSFEYRMIDVNENIVWIKDNVSLVENEEMKPMLCGVMLDITDLKRLRTLEELEKKVLRQNSDFNISLQQLLSIYLAGLEDLFPQLQCSIFMVRNGYLCDGLAPSLPDIYIAAIENQLVGENVGSCGAAAALKTQVIVSDISTDPKWANCRDFTLSHGLWACWSNPVINGEGEVMATLAMYYREPKSPSKEELQVIDRSTALLQIILENRQKTEIIHETNLLMQQSQELAHFGNWSWDVRYNMIKCSPSLYAIYGIESNSFELTFESYFDLLHPDDRSRVRDIVEYVLRTGEDADFEERIIRSNGDVRHLRSWVKLITDANGTTLGMIGASLDNTEKVRHVMAIEQQNNQLQNIAWMQSHLIRSPLTRIMGIVELIKSTPPEETVKSGLWDYLLTSVNELDEQIRLISHKAGSIDGKRI